MNNWPVFPEEMRLQRQRINLSAYAFSVLDKDLESYMNDKKNVTIEDSTYTSYSTIINRILENYHIDAEASICSTLFKYKSELADTFKDLSSPQNKKPIIQALVNSKEKALIEKVNAYEKGIGKNIRVNNSNYATFYTKECPESKYYSRQGQYLKAIIEEYALLPEPKRERILCKDVVDEILSAKADHSLINIALADKTVMVCKPYDIICSNQTHYNYFLAYAKEKGSTKAYSIHSFRISRINATRRSTSRSGKITANELKEIKHLLSNRDVSTITHKEVKITIRLTQKGLEDYHRIQHLRPTIKPTDDPDVYTVNCSEYSAKNYFVRLLDGVEILSPKKLRDDMAKSFESAASIYSKR